MSSNQPHDYEPVVPLRSALHDEGSNHLDAPTHGARAAALAEDADASSSDAVSNSFDVSNSFSRPVTTSNAPIVKRGHALTYAGLFLFSFVLLYRPYEFVTLPSSIAYWLAVATLAVFIPSQLMVEGTLTARPREVNLVLLLSLVALLSVVFAKESMVEGWATFTDIFARAVLMFIVIVNAARTERRLRALLLLSIGSALLMSAGALSDFWSGRLTVEGYRVGGQLGGIFGNPNDMALHLVTMLPIAAALAFGARGLLKKLLYALCVLLLAAGIVVTFSRGGFLAMAASLFVLAWALGRKNRFVVVAGFCVVAVLFFALAPGNYAGRIFSIFDRSLDAYGSADARQALLMRSILVAARNPLLGVGMGNFSLVSIRSQVTHNAYTQVAAEMGAVALVLYFLFIVTPLRNLRRIARETFDARRSSRFYYLSVGLMASLVAYMVASFFASVAYYWNVYYLVGYAVCLHRLYEAAPSEASAAIEQDKARSVGENDISAAGEAVDESDADLVGAGFVGRARA